MSDDSKVRQALFALGRTLADRGQRDMVPPDLGEGVDVHVFDDGLVVSVLSRRDLIRFKLYAAADEGPASWHLHDLIAMGATTEEIEHARVWAEEVANQHPQMLRDVVEVLRGGS